MDPGSDPAARPASSVLKLHDASVALDGMPSFDPSVYYRTRRGLLVRRGFADLVLAAASKVADLPESTIASYELAEPARDFDVRQELGKEGGFGASELCARIAQLIERQPKDAPGDLRAPVHWSQLFETGNIFFHEDILAFIIWDGDDREWCVDAWRCGSGPIPMLARTSRVFSCVLLAR